MGHICGQMQAKDRNLQSHTEVRSVRSIYMQAALLGDIRKVPRRISFSELNANQPLAQTGQQPFDADMSAGRRAE